MKHAQSAGALLAARALRSEAGNCDEVADQCVVAAEAERAAHLLLKRC